MTASAARERARAIQIALGRRRETDEERAAYTLSRGWAAYRELMVRKVEDGQKSAATLANYDRAYRHVEDWAEKPLAAISASTEMVQLRFMTTKNAPRWRRRALRRTVTVLVLPRTVLLYPGLLARATEIACCLGASPTAPAMRCSSCKGGHRRGLGS